MGVHRNSPDFTQHTLAGAGRAQALISRLGEQVVAKREGEHLDRDGGGEGGRERLGLDVSNERIPPD